MQRTRRRNRGRTRPPASTKRIKQIAKAVDRKATDHAWFSNAKTVMAVSDVQRFPRKTMTVRIYGLTAMGWAGGSAQKKAIVSARTIIENFKDYIPAYFKLNSISLFTCRGMTGGNVGNVSGAIPTSLVSVAFTFLGNWQGLPVAVNIPLKVEYWNWLLMADKRLLTTPRRGIRLWLLMLGIFLMDLMHR